MRRLLISLAACAICGLSAAQSAGEHATPLEKKLWKAIGDHDNAAIKGMIAAGLQINKPTTSGELPLAWASERGDRSAVDIMLKAGADPNGRNSKGETPLMEAVQWQNLQTTQELIARSAQVGARDKRKRTVMHFCVNWAQSDAVVSEEPSARMIEELIAAGADPEARDEFDRSPLMWAAGWRHLPSLQALIRRAKIDARDNAGRTALTWASGYGKTDPGVLALVAAGARIHLIDALGFKDGELAAKCLARGDDAKTRGPYGETTLCRAAELGDLNLVKSLIGAGVDVNAADDGGVTALHLACGSRPGMRQTGETYWPPLTAPENRPAIVQALIASRAKTNLATHDFVGSDRETALMWAARASTADVLKALIDGGAQVNQVTHNGYGRASTALNSIVHGFSCRREDPYRMEKAAMLLRAGADPSKLGEKGPLSLLINAFASSNEMISLLLSKSLDVNEPDEYGTTALMGSVVNPRAVQSLLAKGARIDSVDRWKMTALMHAASNGPAESVKILLTAGANLKLRDDRERTALEIARELKRTEIAKFIAEWRH